MGVLAVASAVFAVAAGIAYMLPRYMKRYIVVSAMRLTSKPSDKTLPWRAKVLPHTESLKQIAPNVWTLVGTLPAAGPKLPRRMVVCRLAGTQQLWIHSPVCISEPVEKQLLSLGRVAYIVVPNEMHRLDAHAWSERFPDAKVVCPRAAKRFVSRAVNVHDEAEAVFPEYSPTTPATTSLVPIQYIAPKGVYRDFGELVYLLRHEESQSHSLIFCDLLFNLDPAEPGIDPALVTIGSACGLGCTAIGRLCVVSDGAVARRWFEDDIVRAVETMRVVHVSVAHGNDLDAEDHAAVAAVLRKCAPSFEKAIE
ncbi:hypothetical protein HDU77_002039 [Chytriomyces hyalinus]|nr:hypothetical protein HDU77_002039 [Chytriomyces hyalinus]